MISKKSNSIETEGSVVVSNPSGVISHLPGRPARSIPLQIQIDKESAEGVGDLSMNSSACLKTFT